MNKIFLLSLIALLLTGGICLSSISYAYSSLANNIYESPQYALGFIDVNKTLTVYVNLLGASTFTVS
jgi:hypothetical protein